MGKFIDMASRRARMEALKAASEAARQRMQAGVSRQPKPLARPIGEVIQGFFQGAAAAAKKPVQAPRPPVPGAPQAVARGRPVLRGPGSPGAQVRMQPHVRQARFYANIRRPQLAGKLRSRQEVRAGLAQRIRQGGMTSETVKLRSDYIRLNAALSMELRRRGLTPRDLAAISRAAQGPRKNVA